MISPSEFIHPKDAAALHQLESIPGFPALVKKILELGQERIDYGVNMASNIRLSSTQMPKLYNHLPPFCSYNLSLPFKMSTSSSARSSLTPILIKM